MIGQGRSARVYLAVHLGLDEYRAIKQVSKQMVDYETFCKEALILKKLRHPGIPVIYDLEEDDHYSYLIEEYLEGESLYHLISQKGVFSRLTILRYGIQICRIVHYLHSAGTIPILFLDLQPKNLLVCHDTLKLIDFGQADYLTDATREQKRYGTKGYAAPEQYTCEPLDERTDIYAIGVLLYYMGTGVFARESGAMQYEEERNLGRALLQVIKSCSSQEPDSRYSSVVEVMQILEEILQSEGGCISEYETSPLTIAVLGNKSGVGSTHIALGLSTFLKSRYGSILYEEKNHTGAMALLAESQIKKADQYGMITSYGLRLRPYYGNCVKFRQFPFQDRPIQWRILDYGSDMDQVDWNQLDGVIFLCGGKWWNQKITVFPPLWDQKKCPALLIYNLAVEQVPLCIPEKSGFVSVLKTPYFPNPFEETQDTKSFYEALMRPFLKEQGGTVIEKRKWFDWGGWCKKRNGSHSFFNWSRHLLPSRMSKKNGHIGNE